MSDRSAVAGPMSARAARRELPPGPRLPPVAQAILRIWRGVEFKEHCFARYGDTFTMRVGVGPVSVLTRDRDAVRRLFTGDPLLKRHGNDRLRPFVGDNSLFVLDPAEHLVRRKLLLPPFHGERVRAYADLMKQLTATELDRLRAGDVVAFQPIAQALTLDVIMRSVLGISDPTVHTRLRNIFDALTKPLNTLALLVPALAHRSRWNVLARSAWRLMEELDTLVFEHIAATRSDVRLSEREDILAIMVLARDDRGVGLTDQELRDELVTLIAAGHETTATAIAWGVELLVHNPAAIVSAREGDDAYLDALAKEVLRMHSPGSTAGARHVLEPFAIGPWTLPAGTLVMVDPYGVHYDPTVYPEPHVFRPERFLEDPPDAYAFVPFGGGVHRCLGAALAMTEIKIALHEIVTRLELAPVSSRVARTVSRGPSLVPAGGARVRILGKRTTTAAAG
jgi:cytochrome P450 family 135